MKKVIALFLIAFCLLMPTLVQAQTGLIYNPALDGEGVSMFSHNGKLTFIVYTYGGLRCDGLSVSAHAEAYNCDLNGQRYFYGSDKFDEADQKAAGFLYLTEGLNFPDGIPDETDPFLSDVGHVIIVGLYIMQRTKEGGYRMVVVKFGDELPADDDLFSRIFDFNTNLIGKLDQ